ncbi:transcriptional regulator [Methylopila jiangsuensis]|uniref:HTH-type transcriptional regulator CbbR n=1 Tax=Methylopila jiangsuensis TaxID=586230 RepID=A0A9W6N2G1_9HYPH|nr:LysR family transcriptional regulator [Methylopila jiangsuensis]MDR6285492.1 LysR family transcriptional regulator for metE and metH [Methylopila jiangsuensis]GLK75250.1 transcriptional regulator [Methylopila jiangsuensis]
MSESLIRSLTLKQLRALAEVADTGSVSAAARRLSVTPPAVTMQVQLLEAALGLPLLDRTGEKFRPTDAGREVAVAAARIEAALRDCVAALEAMKGLDGGRVAVAIISTAKYFAPMALGVFARAHPNVDVSLTIGNRAEVIALLRSDAVDVAIMGRPPEDLETEQVVIGDHPHVVIAPPDHPLAGRGPLPPQALTGHTFLMREQGSGTRGLMERLFGEEGVRPKAGMEIGSNETIKQAVIAGLGLAFISAHTVAAEVAQGRLAQLDVVGLPIMRQWYVVRRAGKRLTPPAAAMNAFLSERGAEFLPRSMF